MSRLATLSHGFRSAYLDHDALTAQLQAWHRAFPELTRLVALGRTPEGREIWLLVVGADPDRVRPTAWIDGNMHASELAGSSVALAVAEELLAVHVEPERTGLSGPLLERLRRVRAFVVPRIAPDGAEAVLKTGRYVRSAPRDERTDRGAMRWRSRDIDGDGQIFVMRVQDPTGDYVAAHPDHPDLLSARELGDEGPFYRVYPEGVVEPWDGFTLPPPSFLSDNPVDLNRNFPWFWAPNHEQVGAGNYPASEPEVRAVVDFACAHPEIFAWCNLHCYGGVFIRPLGHQPDSKMDQDDLGIYRQLEAWATEFTGYPMVSGYDEFLYAPELPLHGDISDFAYHQRGVFAYTVELWDLFHRLGMPKPKKFVDYYANLTRAEQAKLATWDRDHNGRRIVRPWRKAHHPQLGEVEVGGIDARFGVWNPPPELLAEVCAGQARCFLRVAAMAPELVVRAVTRATVAPGVTRVEVLVDNVGYLPTFVLSSAKKIEWNEELYAEAATEGCVLVDLDASRVRIGHLSGWGRGVGTGANELAYLRSAGNTASGRASWLVRGAGTVKLRIGGVRTGFVVAIVTVD